MTERDATAELPASDAFLACRVLLQAVFVAYAYLGALQILVAVILANVWEAARSCPRLEAEILTAWSTLRTVLILWLFGWFVVVLYHRYSVVSEEFVPARRVMTMLRRITVQIAFTRIAIHRATKRRPQRSGSNSILARQMSVRSA